MAELQQEPLYERMAGLVTPYGYPLEEHFVTTADGYILRLFRVPHGRAPAAGGGGGGGRGNGGGPRPVVHLQHCLLGASSDWALTGPGRGLMFLLADAGYDVFAGNSRGNTYSRNHTSLGPLEAAFWDFTWDDVASKDLPAVLAYELRVAGARSLAYVGHSQGNTVALALLSSQPQWSQQIHFLAMLAPAAFAAHVRSAPLVALAKLNTDQVFALLGVHEFLPSSEALSKISGGLCRLEPHLCVNLLAMLCGYSPENVDMARLPLYLNHTPSGTSVKNVAQWCQAMRSPETGVMSYFDYGSRCVTVTGQPRDCNLRRYGRDAAPRYNLSLVSTPLAVFSGGRDRLADPADLEELLRRLPADVIVARRQEPGYEHLDFMWAADAHQGVYAQVLELLEQHQGGGSGGGGGGGDGWYQVAITLVIVSAVAAAAVGSGLGVWELAAARLWGGCG